MKSQICLVPKLDGLGGMVSFQANLIRGLDAKGIPYTFDITSPENAAILVIGGTRHLYKLWRTKAQSVRIVQRLNGMNWVHRVEKTSVRLFLRSEINNQILAHIRRYLADHIVYQSDFSRDWWEQVFGPRPTAYQITYNGVDLEEFSPSGPEAPPKDHYRILLVEGHLNGSYARGLEMSVRLVESLRRDHSLPVELMVVGEVSNELKARTHSLAPDVWITWGGVLPRESIPAIDRAAHVLFSTDLNAACPNSVIEAMACGLPVLAYDTGALRELVQGGAGEVVPYGANHWKLADPLIPPLAQACVQILLENQTFRSRARARAEAAFSLDRMLEGYLQALGAV